MGKPELVDKTDLAPVEDLSQTCPFCNKPNIEHTVLWTRKGRQAVILHPRPPQFE